MAKSTHAGLPWLRFICKQVGEKVHFWPFDGWKIPTGSSALVEIYPSLCSKNYLPRNRTADQHDAFSAAAWLRDTDTSGHFNTYLHPLLDTQTRTVAKDIEGWILGVE